MPLTTTVLHDDGVALLALGGELDLAVTGRVDDAVAQVLADDLRLLVVDLSGLTFCDSTGLGTLLRAAQALRAADGTCIVAGATGAVARLLELTSMKSVLTLSPDVAVALTALQRVAQDTPGH